ncbi:MAG: DNA mismatch endonuclease Vsr [Treponema sp.]|nr:DNA mismatch endonuclease Vsr [Candidatus Treponema equifaecale]
MQPISQARHLNMSHIRSTETTPERIIRSALHKIGFRFRKNDRRYPGTPDIVLPHFHAVIFVNGCFWHGHENCDKFRVPKTNSAFWTAKFERNKKRDQRVKENLLNDGWRVGIVWECSITGRNKKLKLQNVTEQISLWLDEEFAESYREF